jgi:hypothetical protein
MVEASAAYQGPITKCPPESASALSASGRVSEAAVAALLEPDLILVASAAWRCSR